MKEAISVKKLDYMNPKNLYIDQIENKKIVRIKDMKRMKRIVESKNKLVFSEELVKNPRILMDELCRNIKLHKVEEKIEKMCRTVKFENAEVIKKDLVSILTDSSVYYTDLICAIYMGYKYNDLKQDLFLYNADKEEKTFGKLSEEAKEEWKAIETKKNQMQSAWESESNKGRRKQGKEIVEQKLVDKNVVRKSYPIPIVENKNHIILSIPGGCFWFHYALMSKRNISIFDLKTDLKSYRRYSFMRMYQIYSFLKDKSIENMLLMEYSLGFGTCTQLASYLKANVSKEDAELYADCCKIFCEIEPFFIRKEIVQMLSKKNMDKDYVEVLLKLLPKLTEIINDVYFSTLEVWWYICFSYCHILDWEDELSLYRMEKHLERAFEEYYDFGRLYEDSMHYCNVKNWRGISGVEDCFVNLAGYRFSDMQYRGETALFGPVNTNTVVMITLGMNNKTIFVEKPINMFGEEILEDVIEYFKEKKVPEDENVYELFYEQRLRVFEGMYKEYVKKYFDADVTLGKTLSPMQLYAVLQRRIIESLQLL